MIGTSPTATMRDKKSTTDFETDGVSLKAPNEHLHPPLLVCKAGPSSRSLVRLGSC